MRRAVSIARRPALPPRALEEMLGLAVADPGRWTAAELAARYDAEPAAAAAVVSLARRRRSAAEDTNTGRRDAVARRWADLPAPTMGGRRRTVRGAAEAAEVADAAGRRTSGVEGSGNVLPSFTMVDEVHEAVLRREVQAEAEKAAKAAVVPGREDEEKGAVGGVAATGASADAAGDGSVEGNLAIDGDEGETEKEAELSATGKWVQSLLAGESHVEVSRKTSYAFIEAGVPETAHRAVWIREGPTGKLRAPTDDERRHLLGGRARKVKIRRKP